LDAARRALGLAARGSGRARAARRELPGRAPRRRGADRGGLAGRRAGGQGLMEAASVAHEHHGPPDANRSSRVDPQILGMLLFIISEVMVFGAFFTAYFFIRIVGGDGWFPVKGHDLPKIIAGFNTAILVSSSLTMHWALEGAKRGNRWALQA